MHTADTRNGNVRSRREETRLTVNREQGVLHPLASCGVTANGNYTMSPKEEKKEDAQGMRRGC